MLCGCRHIALGGFHTLQRSEVRGTEAFDAVRPVPDRRHIGWREYPSWGLITLCR